MLSPFQEAKDSTAMLLLMIEQDMPIDVVLTRRYRHGVPRDV